EVLASLGLEYIVRDEVILITSKEEHDTYLTIGFYRLGQLTASPLPLEAEQLRDVMMDYVHPASWREAGGPGRASHFRNVLVIEQTRNVHEECRQMFAALAEFQEAAHVGDLIVGESPEERKIRDALRNPIMLRADGSLAHIVKALEKACPGVRFEIDDKG